MTKIGCILLASVMVIACGGGSGVFSSPCDELRDCCNRLQGAVATACAEQVRVAESQGGGACGSALEQSRSSGLCADRSSDAATRETAVQADAGAEQGRDSQVVEPGAIALSVVNAREVFGPDEPPSTAMRDYEMLVRLVNGTNEVIPVRSAAWSLETDRGLVYSTSRANDCPNAGLAPLNSIECRITWSVPSTELPVRIRYQAGVQQAAAQVPAIAQLCTEVGAACASATSTCCAGAPGTSCRGYSNQPMCCLEAQQSCRTERDCCGTLGCERGVCTRVARGAACSESSDCPMNDVCRGSGFSRVCVSADGAALDASVPDAGVLQTACSIGAGNVLICGALGCQYCSTTGACIGISENCN